MCNLSIASHFFWQLDFLIPYGGIKVHQIIVDYAHHASNFLIQMLLQLRRHESVRILK